MPGALAVGPARPAQDFALTLRKVIPAVGEV